MRKYTRGGILVGMTVQTEQFGAAVRAARKQARVTVAELAGDVGCSEANIRLIERTDQSPGLDLADRILVSLGRRLVLGRGKRLEMGP